MNEPSISVDDFKNAMRRLPAQVTVISSDDRASHSGKEHAEEDQSKANAIAMTATAVTSLSAEPPQLLICVFGAARAASVIADAGAFCVNLLAVDQVDVATQCALPGLEPHERFEKGEWTASDERSQPMLDKATVNFACRVVSASDHGTHRVFVGHIEQVRFSSGDPLLYHDASYREIGQRHDALHLNWDTSLTGF